MRDDIHKYPSQLAERFQVRMPDGLRNKLREAAEANNRSMNSEIVARLEESFGGASNALSDQELTQMAAKLAEMLNAGVAARRQKLPKSLLGSDNDEQ